MKRDRHFRTTNLNIAVFLYSKGLSVIGVETTQADPSKKEFVFNNSEELEELIGFYKFGMREDKLLWVSVHTYEQARRELLDRLND